MPSKSKVYLIFVILAGLCWGTYVPMIAQGGKELKSSYASFLCVGVAYFLIAILLPVAILWARGKMPAWNRSGVTFATLAGVAGAVGALCVVFATIEFKGPKIYVGPVIFALAPVINTLVSLFWHPDEGALTFGLPREKPHWSLYIGIVFAGLGAFLVLFAKEWTETHHAQSPAAEADPRYLIFVLLAGLCWGTYVPLIAQGGKELKSSYASFLCVGVAYFLIAILFPLGMFWQRGSVPEFKPVGTTLATLAGVAGAVGALCVIFATFEFKGPKIYVAPVIFALAPVINTIVSLLWHPTTDAPLTFGAPVETPHWSLYIGIVLAGAGAGLVLFAKELTEARHTPAKLPPSGAVAAVATEPVKP
jgi:drug/metabolite transporter (DMT)-like permease